MLDITTETKPFPVSVWQVPVGNFCEKGGRFGPHQSAETVNGKINRFENKIAWLAYFNAGIRVVDLSNPYDLKELGYYIPKTNQEFVSDRGRPAASRSRSTTSTSIIAGWLTHRIAPGPVYSSWNTRVGKKPHPIVAPRFLLYGSGLESYHPA